MAEPISTTAAIALGAGPALSGIGNLFGGVFGGNQQRQQMLPGFDLSALYASQNIGAQTEMTQAGQELNAFLGQYLQGEGLQNRIGYNTTMGQFDQALAEKERASKLQTGIASQYASNAIGLQTAEAKAKLATQMGAIQNTIGMRQDQRTAQREANQLALQGSANILQAGVQSRGQLALAGVNNDMQLKQAAMNNATSLTNTGLQGRTQQNLAGIQNQGNLLGAGIQGAQNLMAQGNQLRASQQMTGLTTAAGLDQAGIQAMTQQNIAFGGYERDLLSQALRGTQDLQKTQAQGEIQAGLGAQGVSNQLAYQQGLANVNIGQGQEQLRSDMIRLGSQTDSDIYKSSVGNIQNIQGQQEMLKGTGQVGIQQLVAQTDQQRQIQEDRFAGEASLIGANALKDQEQLIGQTKRDQTMLYGNLQADKVRTDMQQGGAVERAREDFAQKFALQDAKFKQDMAQRRYGAAMATMGQGAFA